VKLKAKLTQELVEREKMQEEKEDKDELIEMFEKMKSNTSPPLAISANTGSVPSSTIK